MTTRSPADARTVVAFWQVAGEKGDWFSKNSEFDKRFRDRFLDLHCAAARRECDGWIEEPEGALALMILLDQYPRNAFRDTAHMYATDPLARLFARRAQAAGHMRRFDGDIRLFFCLPFAHSEALADQDVSVALNSVLGEPWTSHAEGHRDIIRRFGRFPHRNFILDRETTAEEADFLKHGGFAG